MPRKHMKNRHRKQQGPKSTEQFLRNPKHDQEYNSCDCPYLDYSACAIFHGSPFSSL